MKAGREKFEFIGKAHMKAGYCKATSDGELTDYLVCTSVAGETSYFGARLSLHHLFLLVKLRASVLVAKKRCLDHARVRGAPN